MFKTSEERIAEIKVNTAEFNNDRLFGGGCCTQCGTTAQDFLKGLRQRSSNPTSDDRTRCNTEHNAGCYEPSGRCPSDPKSFPSVTPVDSGFFPFGHTYQGEQVDAMYANIFDADEVAVNWGVTKRAFCVMIVKKGLQCGRVGTGGILSCKYPVAGGTDTESGLNKGDAPHKIPYKGAIWPMMEADGVINVDRTGVNTGGMTPDQKKHILKTLENCHNRVSEEIIFCETCGYASTSYFKNGLGDETRTYAFGIAGAGNKVLSMDRIGHPNNGLTMGDIYKQCGWFEIMADLIWKEVDVNVQNFGAVDGDKGVINGKYIGFTTRSNAQTMNVAAFERSGMRHMHRGEYWTELLHCKCVLLCVYCVGVLSLPHG